MAGSFFGFNTALSEVVDDEAAGGPSEDEYDALNNETFGHDDVFDWEVEHEHLAGQLESSRRNDQPNTTDSHYQLEASLSQLVLEELHQSSSLNSSVWRNDGPISSAPPPTAPGFQRLCTVEEIERQLRQGQQQNNYAQHNPNYFQPRGPQMQAPVQMPFNPHNNTQTMSSPMNPNNQMGQMNNHMTHMMNNQMQQYPNQFNNNQNNMNMPVQRPRGYMMPRPEQMMPNYGQVGPNLNQFPPMMNQQRMISAPPGLNIQMPNYGPPGGQYNQNFRTQPMPINHMEQHSMSQPNMMNELNKYSPPNSKMQKSRTFTNSKAPVTQMVPHNDSLMHLFNQQFHNASHHPLLKGMYNNNQQQMFNQHVPYDRVDRNGYQNNYYNRQMLNCDNMFSNGQPEDEYAGLMSQREKYWLLNIQMLQLNTGPPYVTDYYYTMYQERKARKEKESIKKAHVVNQQNHPLYSGSVNSPRPGVKQEQSPRVRHNSNRHNSVGDDSPRTYVPAQFENSLGRLQCGSVTAPRKLIDVAVMQTESGAAGNSPAKPSRAPSVASSAYRSGSLREPRRTKQLLFAIEMMYLELIKLEELNDPLAISTALLMKDREQKALEALQSQEYHNDDSNNTFLRNIESIHKRNKTDNPKTETMDKRQTVGFNVQRPSQQYTPTSLLSENRDDLINKLFTSLLHEDRVQQLMIIRKGKALLSRFLTCVPGIHSMLRMTWSRILRALPAAARRDPHGLAGLAPPFVKYIQNNNGWGAILDSCSLLKEAVDPARTPYVLTTPLTLSCVSVLIEKATELVNTPEATANERTWTKFLKTLARTLKNTTLTIAKPIQPLAEKKLLFHLKQLESRNTIEILQRGKTAEFADLSKSDVLEQLLKNLC